MRDNQEPTVSGGEESTIEEMRAVLREYYIENEEYQKAICIDEQCQRAVDPWYAATHLRNTHKISKKLTGTISKIIREGTIRKGCDKGIPEDGTLPQEGLPVFDGFRCGGCSQFKARSVPEVEGHWRLIWHEETKGSMIERVRLQSSGGRKGADQRLWVVEEKKENEIEGTKEAPTEEAPVEEAPADEEPTEKEPAEEEPAEEEPAEEEIVEDNLKEIPDDITEENEGWNEEEGQEEREYYKEKENLDEWEGNCFEWRCREAEYEGWDEMAGDWVVMY